MLALVSIILVLGLRSHFYNNPEIAAMLAEKEMRVLSNRQSSFTAAREVLEAYFNEA